MRRRQRFGRELCFLGILGLVAPRSTKVNILEFLFELRSSVTHDMPEGLPCGSR